MAQAPVASMHSTSRGITSTAAAISVAVPQLSCIRTTASSIRGGVTTYDEGPRRGHIKKDGETPLPPGSCEHCQWVWDPSANEGKGDWVCSVCGCESLDGCDCDPCHCDVPIGEGVEVWLFLATLAGAYALYKAHVRKEQTI